MTAVRSVEIGKPNSLPNCGLVETVRAVWAESGLLSRPEVRTVEAPLGHISVDGRPIPVSARRVEWARLATGDTSGAVTLLLDAALRADLAELVRTEQHVDPPSVLAAELGLAPSQLSRTADDKSRGLPADPFEACEQLVVQAQTEGELQLTVELHSATLKRLTSGSEEDPMAGWRQGAQAMADELATDYGVRVPPVTLRAVDQEEHLVRFRIGRYGTGVHPVLGESHVVVQKAPELLPAVQSPQIYIDPVRGHRWSMIDGGATFGLPDNLICDPAMIVMRCLFAELKSRLGLFAPSASELAENWWSPMETGHLQLDRVSAATRWLLASQASINVEARLTEAIVTAAAGGMSSVETLLGHLRRQLGPAVQGPVPTATDYEVVRLDDAVAAEAALSGSAEPILDAAPRLRTIVSQCMVLCAERWRPDLARLLHPMADVAIVVTYDEAIGSS
jgi:hypothetical protein